MFEWPLLTWIQEQLREPKMDALIWWHHLKSENPYHKLSHCVLSLPLYRGGFQVGVHSMIRRQVLLFLLLSELLQECCTITRTI